MSIGRAPSRTDEEGRATGKDRGCVPGQLHSILKLMQKRRRSGAREDARIDELLPLRPAAFAVLAALAEGPRPGFEILERVNQVVPSRPLLGPGTLYRLMRELRQARWIERTAPPKGEEGAGDERRQYHGLTKRGRQVLVAESARLRRTLGMLGKLGESHGAP